MVHKKQVIVNFDLNQVNFWFINYNKYIQNKIKSKLHMKVINYVCFKPRSVKKNKNNFINVIGDKFAIVTR